MTAPIGHRVLARVSFLLFLNHFRWRYSSREKSAKQSGPRAARLQPPHHLIMMRARFNYSHGGFLQMRRAACFALALLWLSITPALSRDNYARNEAVDATHYRIALEIKEAVDEISAE